MGVRPGSYEHPGRSNSEEAFLDDVLCVRHRAGHPVCEPEQGQVMLVEKLQEGGLPPLSRCLERIHASPDSITARSEKESKKARNGTPGDRVIRFIEMVNAARGTHSCAAPNLHRIESVLSPVHSEPMCGGLILIEGHSNFCIAARCGFVRHFRDAFKVQSQA